jgi:hypothetical protein
MSAVGVISSAASTAAPRSFELVFEGRHEIAEGWDEFGFWHVGEFRASGPFCSSGRVTAPTPGAVSGFDFDVSRVLSCDDGSGSVIARVTPDSGEHGGTGTWRITSGTGDYAKLRGHGTFAGVQTGGDPLQGDHGSITFRSTWTGTADLDDLAPAIDIVSAAAVMLRRPAGTYELKVALALRDEVEGNPVSYGDPQIEFEQFGINLAVLEPASPGSITLSRTRKLSSSFPGSRR